MAQRIAQHKVDISRRWIQSIEKWLCNETKQGRHSSAREPGNTSALLCRIIYGARWSNAILSVEVPLSVLFSIDR